MPLAARVLLVLAVVSTSFLSGSFQYVGAQSAGDAATTSEPNLEEAAPSSEPAAEEGGSRLERWHPEAFSDPEHEPSSSIEYKSPSASQGHSGEGMLVAGGIGMIATGTLWRARTQQSASSQKSRHRRERRAQWDLQTSRLVF
ncbi:MAG: hypothetical protein JRE45_18280 [Deltaproteobacteria bacterium]|nr:hypothetical protein [Deltaproteobacteria bacterium]